jgi:hypothetical protein
MQQKTFLIVIRRTGRDEVFRPSDWAERLCNMITVFDHGNKLVASYRRRMGVSQSTVTACAKIIDYKLLSMYYLTLQQASEDTNVSYYQ